MTPARATNLPPLWEEGQCEDPKAHGRSHRLCLEDSARSVRLTANPRCPHRPSAPKAEPKVSSTRRRRDFAPSDAPSSAVSAASAVSLLLPARDRTSASRGISPDFVGHRDRTLGHPGERSASHPAHGVAGEIASLGAPRSSRVRSSRTRAGLPPASPNSRRVPHQTTPTACPPAQRCGSTARP